MHSSTRLILVCSACLTLMTGCSLTMPDPGRGAVPEYLRSQSLYVLREAVSQETEWVKVHAAEGLLVNGYPEDVAASFEADLASAEPPYRVGVLRVLAQTAGKDKKLRTTRIDQVLAIFNDQNAGDRLHALETLAKLGYGQRTDAVLEAAKPDAGRFQVYARWIIANSGTPADQASLAELVAGDDATLRTGAAYALRHRKAISPAALSAVEAAGAAQQAEAPDDVYLQSAWFVHCPPDRKLAARSALLTFLDSDKKHERNEVCLGLGYAGGARDVPILAKLLRDDPEADVRVYAAFALLRLARRAEGK